MSLEGTQPAASTSLWRIRLTLASRSVRENWELFVGTRIGIIGLAIIGVYALLALAHPILMNTVWEPRIYDPVVGYAFDETQQPAPPSLNHPLGTDPLGRDILSQLMFSARSEFLLGLLAATVTVVIGTIVGAVAAYFGGIVDTLLMRLADIMIMMPAISVLIVLSALIGVEHFELSVDNRHPVRLRRHRRGAEITGPLRGRQAIHRRGQERGWRTFSHHLGPYRAESLTAFVPLHDVHRDQRDLLRSGAELPRPARRPDELGADDPHHRVCRLPAAGLGILVADIPRQLVDHASLLVLLPRRPLAGRGREPEAPAPMTSDPVLVVDDLKMHYMTRAGVVKAVDGVSFSVERGQSLGLVGESGCGKSSIAMTLLKLLPDNAKLVSGSIALNGVDLVPLGEQEMRNHRWDRISMVFQAAMNSLDPVYRVGDQIVEALEAHSSSANRDSMERVRELFDLVSLDASYILRYPHEYSGGMRQRAIIAMALACEPDIMIADEPTTALDVIVQDHILREMQSIQQSLDMSMIYISHDMAVIAEVCDIVGVMYAGKLVEFGPTAEVYARPVHPYTRALMSAFPSVRGEKHDLVTLPGEPPNLLDPPSGCAFHPRCAYATDECRTSAPPIVERTDHWAVCWNPPGE